MEPLNIKVIVGSTREGRFSERAARWITSIAEKEPAFKVELLDLRDYPMAFFDGPSPSYREGGPSDPHAARWAAKIAEADGFIVVTPEYNHGYPAVLKNAFDWIYHEWNMKPITFVSYGSAGGARSVEQLREVAVELQMASTRNAVHIPGHVFFPIMAGQTKAEDVLPQFEEKAKVVIAELLSFAKALKTVRVSK